MNYAYKYRIYPNKSQAIFIEKHINACRFVYNWGLALRIETYKTTNKGINHYKSCSLLTQLKQQDGYTWLYDVNSQSLQTTLKNLDAAYTGFFKYKKGFPKFKARKIAKASFHIQQGIEVDAENNKLYIPKLKTGIKIALNREPNARIIGAVITKTKSNKFFISVKLDDGHLLPEKLPLDISKAVGIDLGLSVFATLSNGLKIPNPRLLRRLEKQLAKLQKQHSHKTKGSKNKDKLRVRIAILHEKITNQRLDFLHKTSTQLANENQVETYCLETLNIQGMMRNHCLAKSIADVSWAKFIELLTYKCERLGKNILHIGQFEPSSKMCSCGKVNNSLTLKDRNWTCQYCQATHDRDILAANNIKHFAFNRQNLLHLDNTIIGMDCPEYTLVESKKVLLVETRNS